MKYLKRFLVGWVIIIIIIIIIIIVIIIIIMATQQLVFGDFCVPCWITHILARNFS